MKYAILLSLVYALNIAAAFSQNFSTPLAEKFDRQRLLYPQQRIHLHTDLVSYAPGERIWFRAYVLDAVTLTESTEDKYVYVELLNADGFVVKRVKVIKSDGAFSGYLDIPPMTSYGDYFLRCYTLYSSNLGGYDCIVPLGIGKPVKDYLPLKSGRSDGCGIFTFRDEGRYFYLKFNTVVGKCRLAVLNRGRVAYDCPIMSDQRLAFPKKEMPQGVSMFVAYDSKLNVLGKRMVFSPYGDDIAEASVSQDSVGMDNAKSFSINLTKKENARLSVSVTDASLVSDKGRTGLIPQILLSSEIRGGAKGADLLFSNGYRSGAIDSLLRYSVSDRYLADSVIKDVYVKPAVPVETTQCATGTAIVPANAEQAASRATVNLISPRADMFATTTADKNGRFLFTGLDYPDGTAYLANAFTANRRENTKVIMDEVNYPSVDTSSLGIHHTSVSARHVNDGSILLDDVVVTTTRKPVRKDAFSSLADYSLSAENLDNIDATCIHEVLRRIPGIRLKGETCYIRTGTSIYDDTPAAIAIDGVLLDYKYDLDVINLHDIARIDIFKSGNIVIWGSLGGAGVISVTTKNGMSILDGAVVNRVSKYVPLGYQIPATEFASDSGKGLVYWNGNVKMKDGTAHVCFHLPKNSKDSRKYRICVEGVTASGRLISSNLVFECD